MQLNVQKISAKRRIGDPKIQVVTRGEATIGDDKGDISVTGAPWVRKAETKCPNFDPVQEKANFQEARKEFMETEASTSRSPKVNALIFYDGTSRLDPDKNSEADVCNMRNFLQSCMKLIRDQKALEELRSILNNYDREVGGKAMELSINQVRQ